MTTDIAAQQHQDLEMTAIEVEVASSTVGHVLREFDTLRRRVSRRHHNVDGVGVGYDDLEVAWDVVSRLDDPMTVSLVAMVTCEVPGRHRVEYVATAPVASAAGPRPTILVRAHGWTLARSV